MEGGEEVRKYHCLECGYLFYYPKLYVERHGMDEPPYEQYKGCPKCGGHYVPVEMCDGCHEEIVGDYAYIYSSGKKFCKDCFCIRNIND